MKRIWISLFILIFLVSICVSGYLTAQKRTDHVLLVMEEMKDRMEEENYSEALSLCEGLIEEWDHTHHILCNYMYHERLECVDETLALLPAYIRGEDLTSFEAEYGRALAQIRQLTVTERFSLENIL